MKSCLNLMNTRNGKLSRGLMIVSLIGWGMILMSCNREKKQQAGMTQNVTASPFPKGKKVTNDNFTGTVWLNYLSEADTAFNVNIGSVTFEPGARSNWHYHKGGQILLVTEGEGLYQERNKPIVTIQKGDVIKCLPNIEHWHGGSPTKSMTHIAIGTNTNIGGAVWLKPVTDEEYSQSE